MTVPRPIAVRVGSEDRGIAAALLAALPAAMPMPIGGARGRIRQSETSEAALFGWLRDGRPVPRRSVSRWPAAPRVAAPPHGALLIVPGTMGWDADLQRALERRRDLRAVALADWPTAVDWPEYHRATVAAAALGTTRRMLGQATLVTVQDAITADRLMAERPSGAAAPIVVEPKPSALAGTVPSGGIVTAPVMLVCGSIEARANTLLLLHLWRDALARQTLPPKLVLAGPRGAMIEDIAPLLDWNDRLRSVVAEAPGLPAPALRTLIDGAQALLMPDFAGPDVALMRDALALGVPVIAADTPQARMMDGVQCLDPLDGPAWRAAIAAAARAPARPPATSALPDWPGYVERLLAHVEALP